MNSVFVNPGIYSCAVDAFLEISAYSFLPCLSSLRIRNDFTDLLFNVSSSSSSSSLLKINKVIQNKTGLTRKKQGLVEDCLKS